MYPEAHCSPSRPIGGPLTPPAAKNPAIPSAMDALSESLSRLADNAHELASRLNPVLSCEPESSCDEKGYPASCDMQSAIDRQTARVNAVANLVFSLCRRLEI
jgi:hypothetical protein